MIQDVIGEVQMDPGLAAPDSQLPPKAPGMKYRHYAPKAQLILVDGVQQKVQEKIRELVEKEIVSGKTAGIIATDESCNNYPCGIVKSIGTRSDENTIARHLYGILREFDEMDVEIIYSESFLTPKIGQAIMNRMLKAAGHQVIKV